MSKPFSTLFNVFYDAGMAIYEESKMLPDNRLDYIKNIEPEFIDMMTVLRQEFIVLDDKLRVISSLQTAARDGVSRCLSLARTNIETALQQSIKALCLMGEVKG